MAWWGWCIFGTVLLAVELFAVDAQFYLVFAGLAAVIVGLTGLTGIDLPQWAQWLAFAVLSVASMFTLRKQIYLKLMNKPTPAVSIDVDQQVVLTEALAPGKSCRIEYRGSGWTAINVGDRALAVGDRARITAVEGVTLKVHAV